MTVKKFNLLAAVGLSVALSSGLAYGVLTKNELLKQRFMDKKYSERMAFLNIRSSEVYEGDVCDCVDPETFKVFKRKEYYLICDKSEVSKLLALDRFARNKGLKIGMVIRHNGGDILRRAYFNSNDLVKNDVEIINQKLRGRRELKGYKAEWLKFQAGDENFTSSKDYKEAQKIKNAYRIPGMLGLGAIGRARAYIKQQSEK
jgi:hypothetical protein